ncbi:DUF1284 domain-containing protein [Fulvimarina sp. MAC3]|uniref:DUF1284 domain-containing protein n=1 Tax=Fulvimarina sp. MAC3 TaxID=3148887 RepID=UPI0031FBAB59
MTVRLRGHHLLCILTYVGKGYSERFVQNYNQIAKRLNLGEAVEIIEGPDDICAPLLGDGDAHCFRESVAERDRVALRNLSEVVARDLRIGRTIAIDAEWLATARSLFQAGSVRKACLGCEWHDLCSEVSSCGRAEVLVTGHG